MFVKVAQSNLRQIEREIEQKKFVDAMKALQNLNQTLMQTEQTVDFCPSLTKLKNKTNQLLKVLEKDL